MGCALRIGWLVGVERDVGGARAIAVHDRRQPLHVGTQYLGERFPQNGMPGELAPIAGQLNASLDRLQTAFERERRFAADAAHELRTPLSAIRMNADVALKFPDAEQSASALRDIQTAAVRMQNLIERLLELARAAGPGGMAGGQMMDLVAEGQQLDLPATTRLQQLKTGALIEYSVEAGCIMARLPAEARTPYRGYARNIGLAFQIADDLIDHSGDEAAAGKRLGKDAHAGKATFVSLLGEERARQQADFLVNQAIEHLSGHGSEADLLRAIARFAVERDH